MPQFPEASPIDSSLEARDEVVACVLGVEVCRTPAGRYYTNPAAYSTFLPVTRRQLDGEPLLNCPHSPTLYQSVTSIWFPDSRVSLCLPCAERVREHEDDTLCFGDVPLPCGCEDCQAKLLEYCLDVCQAVLKIGRHLPNTLSDLIPLAEQALRVAGRLSIGRIGGEIVEKSEERRYGKCAENLTGTAEDPDLCISEVWPQKPWGWHGYQCRRKRGYGPNGLYCKQHGALTIQGGDPRAGAMT